MRRLALGVTVVAALSALPVAADDSPAPVRRAIVIGINEYRTDEFSDLRGAVNDVKRVRELLTGRFGFADEHVTVLTDRDATRASILEAMDRVAREAMPDDLVFFHYSGHGSQVRDLDGDEPDDDVDETILPHDARTEGVADITDDELGAFLARLRAGSAIVVLDSCHSGTATRGGLRTRNVPADPRIELYRRQDDGVKTRAIVKLDLPERYVLLTGAAAHQSALDGPVDGTYYGLFSYALTEGLAAADPDASPRELHESIRRTFARLSEQFGGMRLPEPQVEAASTLLDAPLFPGSRGAAGGQPALPTPVPPSRVPVRWDGTDPALSDRLERHVRAREPDVEFVPPDEFARFVVQAVDGRVRVHGAAGLTVIDEFRLTTDEDAAKRLATLFSRSLKASSLVSLTNPASSVEVTARVVGTSSPAIREPGTARSDANSLMLEITTNRDSFITLVDVDATGGINLLFPNSYTKEGFLPQGFVEGGRPVRIPDSLESGNRAGFFWDYQPPAGLDTVQIFATTDLATAETIRRWLRETPGVVTRGAAATSARSDAERLAGLRSDLLHRVSRRGIGVVRDSPETGSAGPPGDAAAAADWNAVTVNIRVGE